MQVRISDPRFVIDLIAFLERAEYRALQVGPAAHMLSAERLTEAD